MLRGKLLVAACIALVTSGCGQGQRDAVFFPRYVGAAGGPVLLARLAAQLIETDGCLWLRTDTGMFLAIWPNPMAPRWDGAKWIILDSTGAVVAATGRTVVVGGGELPRANNELVPRSVTDHVKVTIPERCAVHGFWKVTSIRFD